MSVSIHYRIEQSQDVLSVLSSENVQIMLNSHKYYGRSQKFFVLCLGKAKMF